MKRKDYTGDIAKASPRPWRIEHVDRKHWAYVKAANGEVVTLCHADNAALIVAAANACAVQPTISGASAADSHDQFNP